MVNIQQDALQTSLDWCETESLMFQVLRMGRTMGEYHRSPGTPSETCEKKQISIHVLEPGDIKPLLTLVPEREIISY